ncbi:GUN4 domain protein (fragment) [Planktothrix tepida PCC 9214]|uniref:GUN4 domain protein n=2 Tax=Planktothrix TaxID=54304 RepID=A0A1J1LFE5_9CYAN
MSEERLKQALRNWQDKLAHFEYELSYTASAEKKFELRKCIEECDTAIQRLKTTISDLEQEQQKQQLNSPNIPQIVKIELKSEKGVDYSQLRDLLASGKWREADEETARVMYLAAGRQKEGWLRVEDIDNFPCEDLRTINQLWLHYSNGKFGFSVQKEIYQSLGGTREYNEEVWKKFCDRVGWREKGEWLSYKDLTFDPVEARSGYLPFCPVEGGFLDFGNLFSRAETCNL